MPGIIFHMYRCANCILPTRFYAATLLLLTWLFLGCGNSSSNATNGNGQGPTITSKSSAQPRDWIKAGEYYDHFADLNAPILAIPETERAWLKYREVLPKLKAIDSWKRDAAQPDSAAWDSTVTFLNANRNTIDQLVVISQMPQLGFPLDADLNIDDSIAFGMLMQGKSPTPRLMETVLLATAKLSPAVYLMNAAARDAAIRNDGAAALKYHQAALNLCNHLGQQPGGAAQRIATERTIEAFTSIRNVMQNHPQLWNAQQLNELKSAIENFNVTGMANVIEFDGFRSIIDTISVTRNDKQGFEGALMKLGTTVAEAKDAIASPSEEIDFLEGLKTKCNAEYSKAIWERTAWSANIDLQELTESKKKYFSPLLYPALEPTYYLTEVAQQERSAALVTAGLLIYHTSHGTWPQDLAELQPAIIATLPVDRFDGKPFRYAYAAEKATLYSVFLNGKEDPGALMPIPTSITIAQLLAEKTAVAKQFPGDWLLWTSGGPIPKTQD